MALLFFFGGLFAFLFPVNKGVAFVALAILVIIGLLYVFMTVLLVVWSDCPYKTPLSNGRRVKYDNLIHGLLEDPQVMLGSSIEHLMLSCESGLLEPNIKSRRQISCLKAIWCLGMAAEKNDKPVPPLLFLQDSRFLPPPTSVTAQYLPSITALTGWNTLCSLHGHVEKPAVSLRESELALNNEGRLPNMEQYRLDLEEFLINAAIATGMILFQSRSPGWI
ncbi:hypothetical protein FB451DRAFT_1412593 [Mycena latifolia]|nr:hypothetical protein FB451DRAFT_1412593 [Mycena latifolia]